jgi:hypothetical protein
MRVVHRNEFIFVRRFFMFLSKRGKLARAIKGWRGSCPACSRTGVKLLWEKTEGEKTLKVCKQCGEV